MHRNIFRRPALAYRFKQKPLRFLPTSKVSTKMQVSNVVATARTAFSIAVALTLAGCDFGKPKDRAGPPPPRVVTVKPTRTITEWDDYTGRFTAVESVQIRARVSGYLTNIHFRDGQLVKQGDLLFTIDRRPFEATVAAAEAEAKVAEASLSFARQELARAQALRKSDTVPERLYDERSSAVSQAEARLASAKANLDRANLDLEFTEVRSPISGRIDTHTVSVGNLINGGDTSSTLLTNIVSLDPMRFTFDVDQASYLRYVRGAIDGTRPSLRDSSNGVRVSLPGDVGYPRTGKLDFVSNQIDAGSATVRMRALVENKDLALAPGLFAKIQLAGGSPYSAILVPDEAIATDQGSRVAFVVRDKKAELRTLTIGPLIDGLRVVRSGIEPDDKVITSGAQGIKTGQEVAVVESGGTRQTSAYAQTGGVVR